MRIRRIHWAVAAIVITTGLLIALPVLRKSSTASESTAQTSQGSKEIYISFDDYYYEVPKQKTVDDKIVAGAQFVYNLNAGIKTSTLDDLFDDGAVGVQALVPLNGDNQAFERYLNNVSKPAAASAFQGSADLSFSDRKDGVKAADLVSKKDGQIIRRQYIVNLPQSIAVVSKDDSEAFRSIGRTIGQASAKFSDYGDVRIQVLAQSFMLKNRMFEDIYAQAHEDLKGTTSVDELNRIADQSKDIFALEVKISGVKVSKKEMSATILFADQKDPAKSKTGSFTFRQSEGKWKLFTLQLPNGSVTGTSQ
ncbi:MAG: hypothetical protein AAB541_02865 [Patescibacteria group bacterium]